MMFLMISLQIELSKTMILKRFAFATFIALLLLSCTREQELQINHIENTNGYSQVVEVRQGKVSTFYVSGQISSAQTKHEQIREAFLSVEKQLAKVGADLKDVVKMNTYIVDYQQEDLQAFREIRRELMGNNNMPASTLVGVSALALPEWKVEIEAVAVLAR